MEIPVSYSLVQHLSPLNFSAQCGLLNNYYISVIYVYCHTLFTCLLLLVSSSYSPTTLSTLGGLVLDIHNIPRLFLKRSESTLVIAINMNTVYKIEHHKLTRIGHCY